MPKKQTVSKIFIISLPALLVGAIAFAWSEPGSNPPSGNAAAPLNVSGTAQIKVGELTFPKMVDYNDTGYYADPQANSWLYRIYSYDIRSDIYYDRNNTAFYMDPAGNTVLNALTVNGNIIANDPTASNHAATKGYVDAQVGAATPGSWTTTLATKNTAGCPTYSDSVICPVGYKLITGGCGRGEQSWIGRPVDNGWNCYSTDCTSFSVVAWCAK